MTTNDVTCKVRDTGKGVLLYTATYREPETGIIYENSGSSCEDAIHSLLTSLLRDYLSYDFSDNSWYEICQAFGRDWQAYVWTWKA